MAVIRYLVKDVEQSVAFYTELLGFEAGERWGSAFATVNLANLTLWLSGPETSAAKPMPDGSQPEPGGWNRLVIETNNITEILSKLKLSDVVFRNEVLSGPGGKQILFEDPSGNPIELFEAR
ncbi:MAG: VOC family protein [Chloroflexi bacterium]|nr:VOC family protein [Chloroflexota bacterium]